MADKVDIKVAKKADKADKAAGKKTGKKNNKKPNIFARIAKYFRECKAEVKKITWPAPKAVFKNFGIVLVIMVVMGLFIFALDQGLFALLSLVMETSAS
ncbi:MAG: preprotein translocase subunit SecE [Acutalibacteraceae bacterium]|nr:preprotein translocase subunit SecE [Acutalibacteraceae bacterium]